MSTTDYTSNQFNRLTPTEGISEDEGFDSPSICRTSNFTLLRKTESNEAASKTTQFGAAAAGTALPDAAAEEGAVLCPQRDDAFEGETRQLVEAVVKLALGHEVHEGGAVQSALLQSCDALLQQNPEVQSLLEGLTVTADEGLSVFTVVADELFEGHRRVVTWHRIVALFCFTAEYAKRCKKECLTSDDGRAIVDAVTSYTIRTIGPFVNREGGWVSLCTLVPPNDSSLWSLVKWGALGVGMLTASHLLSH